MKRPSIYLPIYGTKPNTHATPVWSTEPLQVSKVTASTLGFQLKARWCRTLSPQFTHTHTNVSYAFLKAYFSNSSKQLANAAQPSKSGHTRDKDQAQSQSICHRRTIWQLKICINALKKKKAFREKSTCKKQPKMQRYSQALTMSAYVH